MIKNSLTGKQKSFLRSLGMSVDPVVNIGKEGVTPTVVQSAQEAMKKRELIKIRVLGAHKSTEKGEIETDNPYGSTEKYSVLRYEEEVDGEIQTLIDSTAGIIRINGKDYSSELTSLLD